MKTNPGKTAARGLPVAFYLLIISITAFGQGNTWIVNDTSDANTGAGTSGTLRFALSKITAPTQNNPDTIKFDLPDNLATPEGYFIFTPTATVNALYNPLLPVVIMGYSQGVVNTARTYKAVMGPISNRIIRIVIDGSALSRNQPGQPYIFRALSSQAMAKLDISGITFTNIDRQQGVAIRMNNNGGVQGSNGIVKIWGCQFGVAPNGMAPAPNTPMLSAGAANRAIDLQTAALYSKVFVGTDGNGINDENEGNLISNNFYGIFINGNFNGTGTYATDLDTVFIAGNYLGTDAAGMNAIGDSTAILLSSPGKTVVGIFNASLARDTLKRNIISGNGWGINGGHLQSQINTFTQSQTATFIAGNYIGTKANGMEALPNVKAGINLSSTLFRIGTNGDNPPLDTMERNIVSGNTGFGISLGGANQIVAGNYIGVGKDGMTAVPNGLSGISANAITNRNMRIGAANSISQRNIISGNIGNGISFMGDTIKIAGNYIGVGKDGVTKVPNQSYGIFVSADPGGTPSRNIRIGTAYYSGISKDIERNVIAGNGITGIHFAGLSRKDTISGNYIGVNAAKNNMGNLLAGIVLKNGCDSIIIGAHDVDIYSPDEANIIAANGTAGITVGNNSDPQRATRILVSQNSFYRNGNLPVDLDDNSAVNPNTGSTRSIANNLAMNYPILTSGSANGGILTVSGYVGNCDPAAANFRTPAQLVAGPLKVQLYIAENDGNQNGTDCNAVNVAHGEGKYYLGTVTTDADGTFTNRQIDISGRTDLPDLTGKYYTAIAMDANNNTSEFGTSGLPDVPLPLRLLSLKATVDMHDDLVEWTTADEKNTAFFDILYSNDGRRYEAVGRVAAAGNSNGVLSYSFRHPVNGDDADSYYRLKIMDNDGQYALSKIVMISRTSHVLLPGEVTLDRVSPQPFHNDIRVEYGAGSASNGVVKLHSISGQLLLVKQVSLLKGHSFFTLNNLEQLSPGTYLLTLQSAQSKVMVIKLQKN